MVALSYPLCVMVGAGYRLMIRAAAALLESLQAVQALTTLARAMLPRLN